MGVHLTAEPRHPLRWLVSRIEKWFPREADMREPEHDTNVRVLLACLADAERERDEARRQRDELLGEVTDHLRAVGTPDAHSETWPCPECVAPRSVP